jgi:hypothetical protein
MKLGRNDPCRCGSGKKYKKCCSPKDEAAQSAEFAAEAAARAASAASAASEQPEQENARVKPSNRTPNTGAVTPRPKGPPLKSPTQVRRRAV